MLGGKTAFGNRLAEGYRLRTAAAGPEQIRLETVEELDLLGRRQGDMVGDVVGRPHEFVKGEDRRAVAQGDEARGDGEVLVAMALAGPEFVRTCHCKPACTRPFHSPPAPRAC